MAKEQAQKDSRTRSYEFAKEIVAEMRSRPDGVRFFPPPTDDLYLRLRAEGLNTADEHMFFFPYVLYSTMNLRTLLFLSGSEALSNTASIRHFLKWK